MSEGSGPIFAFRRRIILSLFQSDGDITRERERIYADSKSLKLVFYIAETQLRLSLREQYQQISESKVIKI